MDSDSLIGGLYRELQSAKEAGASLIALVAALKNGKISLEQIEVEGDKVRVHKKAVEEPKGSGA